MQKLDWYIVKKFLGTFFFSISLILLIVVVFDISEKIDDFIEKDAPLKELYSIIILILSPTSVTFSVLYSLLLLLSFSPLKWLIIQKLSPF